MSSVGASFERDSIWGEIKLSVQEYHRKVGIVGALMNKMEGTTYVVKTEHFFFAAEKI